MEQRASFQFTSIAALGALVYLLSGAPSQPNPPANTKSANKAAPASSAPNGVGCENAVYELLCSFYQTRDVDTVKKAIRKPGSQVLLATIPDPLESSSGTDFDAYLDALRMAAVAAGYVPDRFFLPWTQPNDQVERTHVIDSEPQGGSVSKVKVSRKEARGLHEKWPGALLFRGKEGVLFILLIGETATLGIHPMMASDALWYLDDLMDTPSQVGVIGPAFSGSADSLRLLLSQWRPSFQHVSARIVSGSATSDSVSAKLAGWLGVGASASFQSMMAPDSLTTEVLRRHLHRLGFTNNLLLHEADTAYGSEANADWRWRASYPVHIAQVREAYEAHGLNADREDRVRSMESRPFLPLTGGEAHEPGDLPPHIFPGLTARQMDLKLQSLLDVFQRRAIDSVTILGTSVYDKIFMASRVRAAMPEAQLVLLESHTLYTHPEYLDDLLGAWVVSTYPRPAFPVDAESNVTGFRSAEMEGTYNALLAALHDLEPNEGRRAMLRAAMMDYTSDGAVWLSIVGRGALWPIQPLAIRADAHNFMWAPTLATRTTTQAQLPLPLFPYGLLLIAASALALHWAGYYWGNVWGYDPTTYPPPWPFFRSLSWLCHSTLASRRERWIAAALLGLFGATVGAAHWATLVSVQRSVLGVGLLLTGIGPVGLLLAAGDLSWPALARPTEPKPRQFSASLSRAVRSLPVPIGFVVLLYLWPGAAAWSRLQAERALSFDSGLSAPLCLGILTTSVMLGWYGVARNQRLAHHASYVTAFADPAPEWKARVEHINDVLRWQPRVNVLLALAGGMLIAGILVVRLRSNLDVEVTVFAYALLPIATALILLLVLHALSIWRTLRPLLRSLAVSSLADGFENLPDQRGRTVSLRPSGEPCAAAELRWDIDRVDTLVTGGFFPPAERPDCAAWRAMLAEIGTRTWWTYSYETDVQRSLSGIAGKLLAKGEARDLVASQITRFIALVMSALKNAIGAASATALFLLLGVASYPMHPHRLVMRCAMTLLLIVTAVSLGLIVQADRNELLSRIASRSRNKIDLDATFLSQIGAYVILPLAAALTTQFPALRELLLAFQRAQGH